MPSFSFENAYKMLTARKQSNENTLTNSTRSEQSISQIAQQLQQIKSTLPQSKTQQKILSPQKQRKELDAKSKTVQKTKSKLPPKYNHKLISPQNTNEVIQTLQNKFSQPVRLQKKLDFAELCITQQGQDSFHEDDSLLEFIQLEKQGQQQCDTSISSKLTEQLDFSTIKSRAINFNERLEKARKELIECQKQKGRICKTCQSDSEEDCEIPNER